MPRPHLLAALMLSAGSSPSCTPTPQSPLQAPVAAKGHTIVLDAAGADDASGRGDTGWWPAVVFDSADQAHIAFCDAHHGDVRYAAEQQGTWRVKSVVSQGAVGKYISLGVDSRGRPGIGFYDQDKMYLRYAWRDDAGTWQTENIAWGREVGMGSELLFDAQNLPHLFYYLPGGKLVHAVRQSGEWRKQVLAEVMGVYSVRISAVARPDGIWLTFVDWQMRDAALYLGHIAPDGSFTKTLVRNTGGPGWHSQLVFLPDGPLVVHSQELTRQTAMSRPGPPGPKDWESRPLVAHGSTFVARPWRDGWVMAFQDTSNTKAGGLLRYTVSGAAAAPWPVYRIDDEGPVGGYLGMGVSRTGRLLVAYYADALHSLKLYEDQLTR